MIKKIFRLVAGSMAALLLLSASVPSVSAQARGAMTLGLSGGYATENNGGYTNLFFLYSFAPHVRIAPELGCVFRNDGKSAFIMSADMHFPFSIARGVQVYPLAGLTFNNWSYSGGSSARLGGDVGAGFDINMTQQIKLTVQGKYSLMKDYSGGFIGMGIGYNF